MKARRLSADDLCILYHEKVEKVNPEKAEKVNHKKVEKVNRKKVKINPPAAEPPAAEPPAAEPPAAEPPAVEPPGTEPPVAEPPAAEPSAGYKYTSGSNQSLSVAGTLSRADSIAEVHANTHGTCQLHRRGAPGFWRCGLRAPRGQQGRSASRKAFGVS